MVKIKLMQKLLEEDAKSLARLISDPGEEAQKADAIMHDAEEIQSKIYDGLAACVKGIRECPDSIVNAEDVIEEIRNGLKSITTADQIKEKVASGSSLKELLGISDSSIEALYQGARLLFQTKAYPEAENAFFLICYLHPLNATFWIGLGHSSFQNQNYELAIKAYGMASGVTPEDPWPHIWAASCFSKQKDVDLEKIALDEAISLLKSSAPINYELLHSCESQRQKI